MLGTNFRQRFAGCPQKQPRSPGNGFGRLSDAGEVTELLREWSEGKPDALERLFDVVYPHLRQIRRGVVSPRTPGKRVPTSAVYNLLTSINIGLPDVLYQ